jgi:Gene product 88
MLTQGNHKLGSRLIWSFSLPSARSDICKGMSGLCQHHCYARRLEELRPSMRARYQANYQLSLTPRFARRVQAFLVRRKIAVVRLHVGGDFYSQNYAHQWLRVMQCLPQVRFYFYTRAWRDEAIRLIFESMAVLPNCRVWYSCDRETGIPTHIPPNVRLAWLSITPDDLPPPSAVLVFRIRRLRSQQATHLNGVRVCPAEDGVERSQRVTCEHCQLCWQPLLENSTHQMSLPVLPDNPSPCEPPAPPA